jgi:hypothetical protein
MADVVVPYMRSDRSPMARLVEAGLATAVIDGMWAVVLTYLYGRSLTRLWQGIAATVFGEGMYDGGMATVLLGIAMHVGVAFAWSAVFLIILQRSAWLRSMLESPLGTLRIAVVYGPLIWIIMSAVVIPLLTGKPLVVTGRWWIQLAGHAVFVGLPIVSAIGRGVRGAGRLVTI